MSNNWGAQKPPLGAQVNWGHPLSKGLIGCWVMNEGGGKTLEDACGKNYLSIINPAPSFVNSTRGRVVNLDGTTDYLVSNRNFISGTSPISYGAWLKTSQNETTNKHIFNIGTAVNNNMSHLILWNNAGVVKWKFGAWGFDNSSTTTGVNDNLWHHIMVVYNGANYKLYIDGKLDATSAAYSSLNIVAATLYIGAYRGDTSETFTYKGWIDQALVYNRALSQAEIISLYRNPYQFISRPDIGADEYVAAGGTPSSSPSASVSASPSSSISASPSSSVSASPSSSVSASPSSSISGSPSSSVSSSPSASVSGSPSASISGSPSASPSSSVSSSPSSSVSGSPSASISSSPSSSISSSPSASISSSPSASVSESPSSSTSGSPSASPSASVSASPSASISASPSASPSGAMGNEDTYFQCTTDAGGSDILHLYIDGVEVARFKPNGDVDLHGVANNNAF